eukprot:g2634.t1
MGKKKTQLGRALVKAKAKQNNKRNKLYKNAKVTGLEREQNFVDYGGIDGSTSITELNSLDDFIAQAKLANRKFQTERTATIIARGDGDVYADDVENEEEDIHKLSSTVKQLVTFEDLGIPRRPPWTKDMTSEQLDVQERKAFIDWRRGIAELEEKHENAFVTPFEKNLQFWRQLWRTMERSHLVCQIVDARNPLLFRCKDIERYASEMNENKVCLLLINKADYLSEKARKIWANYFESKNINFVYFSAKMSQEIIDHEDEVEQMRLAEEDRDKAQNSLLELAQSLAKAKIGVDETDEESKTQTEKGKVDTDSVTDLPVSSTAAIKANYEILDRMELVSHLKAQAETAFNRIAGGSGIIPQGTRRKRVPTIGMVGYPNVGKSSVINVILGVSKSSHGTTRVAVGSTPGKTKHFQTIVLSDNLTLCDCPGLVFPTFMSSKAEMVCNGILPIDQMRDYLSPCEIVVSRVYPEVFEETYGLSFPKSSISGRRLPLNAHSLLQAYSLKRGYMGENHSGPDEARGSRYILKDFVEGKILWCCPPPGMPLMSLMEPPKVEKINDPNFNLALRNQNLMAGEGGQVLSNGVTLVVGGANDGKVDTNVSASVEDSGIGDVDEDFEMTLEEAAALLGEDDLELEDEKMMREHLKHESKKKQKHKSLKKHGRKGRIRTANPYGDEESSRVYGVQIQIAGNKGKGSKRKQKMRAKHTGKRSDL